MKTKGIYLFFLSMMVCYYSNCQTTISGGTVSGSWNVAGSPYLISGSIMIPQDSTLIIEPGVTVNFQGHYKLLILGRLLAIGTFTDTIYFTASDTAIGWYGIRFVNTALTSDTSKIQFCKINYGKANGSSFPDNTGGAISISGFSKVIISNCLITYNLAELSGGGVSVYQCDPIIRDNIISYNTVNIVTGYFNGGGGIKCLSSNAIISNNIIKNNTTNSPGGGGGGGINFTGGSPIISNNEIIYNSAAIGGGGGIWSSGNATLIGNTISNNIASIPPYGEGGGGVYNYYGDYSVYYNNTITNNSTLDPSGGGGGAIFCTNSSSPTFINTTISNNKSARNGGALYCEIVGNPSFKNCIIWNNSAALNGQQVYLDDEASDPNFSYCVLSGGVGGIALNGNFFTGLYLYNLDTNPVFANPSSGNGSTYNGIAADWSLQYSSPCINRGDTSGPYPLVDKSGNIRIIGGRIDMGAFENCGFNLLINLDGPTTICQGDSVILFIQDSSALTFQWQKNLSNIIGEIDSLLHATQSGNYSALIIDSTGCIETSPPVTVTVQICASLNEISPASDFIKVFPNPTSNFITIESSDRIGFEKIVLYSLDNKIVKEKSFSTKLEKVNIDLSEISSGIYFLECVRDLNFQMVKIIKY